MGGQKDEKQLEGEKEEELEEVKETLSEGWVVVRPWRLSTAPDIQVKRDHSEMRSHRCGHASCTSWHWGLGKLPSQLVHSSSFVNQEGGSQWSPNSSQACKSL